MLFERFLTHCLKHILYVVLKNLPIWIEKKENIFYKVMNKESVLGTCYYDNNQIIYLYDASSTATTSSAVHQFPLLFMKLKF